MGATNISTIVKKENTRNMFETLIETRIYDIDFTNPDFTGITGQFTHPIVTINAGEAILKGVMIVLTKLESTDNLATITWSMVEALSATATLDGVEFDAGDVYTFGKNDSEDVAGLSNYTEVADTLDLIVADKDITAGRFLLLLDIIKVTDDYDNSL